MDFKEFHNQIHQKGYMIVCLNDYKLKGQHYTFIAVQDKDDHGFHAEGPSNNLAEIYQEIITKIENSEGK